MLVMANSLIDILRSEAYLRDAGEGKGYGTEEKGRKYRSARGEDLCIAGGMHGGRA